MATVEEAAKTFAQDMVSQNIAGLMMVFTPEGMMKAMGLQAQMQSRAMQAMAAGKPPAPMTGYTIDAKGKSADSDDEVIHLNLESGDGAAEVMTKWREVEGVWKVTDLALVGARDADGNPVDLNAPSPAAGGTPASAS